MVVPTDDDSKTRKGGGWEAEQRHEPTGDRWWGEVWEFECATPTADLGLFARLSIYPNLKQTWFWAAVVRDGEQYVLCRDHDLAAPKPPWPLEIRGGSLWSHAICETPFEHWTVAMEAYAVGFDDPNEAWRHERGDKVGLAFDLEWERTDMLTRDAGEGFEGYGVPCRVSGDLQIDDLTIQVDTGGHRMHRWGVLGPNANTWTDPQLGAIALRTAPLQIEMPDGSSTRVLRSLRRRPDGTHRWDFNVVGGV